MKAWAAEAPNATEWYYPLRLRLDLDVAHPLRQNAAARFLGLRLLHGTEIDVPVYAYSTAMTKGRVARGARRLVNMSRVPSSTVVDDRSAGHLDPLSAAPRTNRFLETVVPFLKREPGVYARTGGGYQHPGQPTNRRPAANGARSR